MKLLIRVVDSLTRVAAMTATLALALIVVAYSFEVVSRYFFDAPTLWASDLVGVLLCAMIFLILPEITRSHGHVTISILAERLHDCARAQLTRWLLIIGALVCFGITAICASEALRQLIRGVTTVAVYPLPKWTILAVITFGFLLAGLQFLLAALMPDRTRTDTAKGFT